MRRILSISVLVAAILGSMVLWRDSKLAVADFTAFWIAGHQLVRMHNPYDRSYALRVERSMGFTESRPLMMRNPPWALWVVIPLGVLGARAARLVWTVCLVIILWVSAVQLWLIYDGSARWRWVAVLLAFSFGPTLACLAVGQTAPLVLLGFTLFLCLNQRHEFSAGCALLPAAFKPQVAFLFWLALVLWSVQYRKWRLMAGLILSLTVATGIAALFDSQVMNHYGLMLREESIETQFIPTLAGALRQVFGRSWLELLPATLGIALCLLYYLGRRHDWNWRDRLPILLLASMLLTPYAWLADELVLLAALIAASAAISTLRRSLELAIPFFGANLAIIALLLAGVRVNSPAYLWTVWAWASLYFAAQAGRSRGQGQSRTRKLALRLR
ncbi:MAG: DUF2029 domain-containing protein [Acidobacteria bacterium]|nr:DUF2029 domain-containing protein [Acidobacteriota bacterium]